MCVIWLSTAKYQQHRHKIMSIRSLIYVIKKDYPHLLCLTCDILLLDNSYEVKGTSLSNFVHKDEREKVTQQNAYVDRKPMPSFLLFALICKWHSSQRAWDECVEKEWSLNFSVDTCLYILYSNQKKVESTLQYRKNNVFINNWNVFLLYKKNSTLIFNLVHDTNGKSVLTFQRRFRSKDITLCLWKW